MGRKRKLNYLERMEAEANLFAMCLLVPDFWLEETFAKGNKVKIDVESDPQIKKWARELGVSEMILILRISMFLKERGERLF